MARRRNPTYYEGDLREALLASTVELLERHGASAISLRMVARHTGVSHAAPAHHFQDKAGLFTALAIDGFGLLAHEVGAAVDALPEGTGAAERLRVAGEAYMRFADRYAGHFAVMWRPELQHRDDPVVRDAAGSTLRLLVDLVRAAQREGWAVGADPQAVAFLAWSCVHGLVVLWKDGPLPQEAPGQSLPDVHRQVSAVLVEALARPPA